ncbi:MAG: hypothetical protein U0441_08750 [Polyangiaceae bacterium]
MSTQHGNGRFRWVQRIAGRLALRPGADASQTLDPWMGVCARGLVPALAALSATCGSPQGPGPTGPLPSNTATPTVAAASCKRTIHASVVALDQVMVVNRLGAVRPLGLTYALERDVAAQDGGDLLEAGKVRLRDGKRPRPIVLRIRVGDCLEVDLKNLLAPAGSPVTRAVGLHVAGLSIVASAPGGGPADGTFAGENASSLIEPGKAIKYKLYAGEEGTFLAYSTAADWSGVTAQQLTSGLFGAVTVEPETAELYRSQVGAADLALATTKTTPDGHPILDYAALYPADYDTTHPGARRACAPVLRMVDTLRVPTSLGGKLTCREIPGALETYHSDLTAIVTGPGAGRFPDTLRGPMFEPNPEYPDRRAPYREVTIHYHESQDVLQPFPNFYDTAPDSHGLPSSYTLRGGLDFAGSDAFAINYGVAGVGAEVLANRLGVGPMGDCPECKFEEFFLSSWAVGDPSMVVDVPANAPLTTAELEKARRTGVTTGMSVKPGPKATKAYFPDDPSNVYHAYLGDRAVFRVLHAGASVHHVHHHHAHQWLRTPASDRSQYLDSQAIGPGATFSSELVYGSGNRNLTPGDAIFHCHFYPHFAAGMWGLFRVHDVLEQGTPLDAQGRPVKGSRALPDAEIKAGTPIPAVVPLPTIAMAPMPGKVEIVDGQPHVVDKDKSPGYPFFVPGVAGHRAPAPPLDFAITPKGEVLDGGLPRHIIQTATVVNEKHDSWDFSKDLGKIQALEVPEDGTSIEKAAMKEHATREHPSFKPDGSPGVFVMNGRPPARGAPFADPAVKSDGTPVTDSTGAPAKPRVYKGATLQVDAVLNKKGWHFPQQRMMALWKDVGPTVKGDRPPEPLFFRANSGDVIEYWHSNLVPDYYELDDFQVRTPTDILGQHIHLVKFDVMASDGAANGWNYEDGTLSPDEVRARIGAINEAGGLLTEGGKRVKLTPKPIAEIGAGPRGEWIGAQATVQRWWADPVLDNQGKDRTLTTVFTHDHYGPSTHQQAGLYGGLLIEPAGSRWTTPDGAPMGTRDDGGPTSYAANILTADPSKSVREFALGFQDLQLTYGPKSPAEPVPYRADCDKTPTFPNCVLAKPNPQYTGWASPANAVNAPVCAPPLCASAPKGPMPGLISNFGSGTMSMSYREEPLGHRLAKVGNPASLPPDQAAQATDPSHAFRSIPRLDPDYDRQPPGGSPIDPSCDPKKGPCLIFPRAPISGGMGAEDPYTPLLRAYAGDRVQFRLLCGAHTSMNTFAMHGNEWLMEAGYPDSGHRASQLVLLSEHFEPEFSLPPPSPDQAQSDYLYQTGASYEGQINGMWGLVRAYGGSSDEPGLARLPSSPKAPPAAAIAIPAGTSTDCSKGPCVRKLAVSAMTIQQATGTDQGLVYNGRGIVVKQPNGAFAPDPSAPIVDPGAMIYVRDEDIDPATGHLKKGVPIEPLVLRVAAGDWVEVTLRNRMKADEKVFRDPVWAFRSTMYYTAPYKQTTGKDPKVPVRNELYASSSVGLHAQLLGYDVTRSDGSNVGTNPVQTVSPTEKNTACSDAPCRKYVWYAGALSAQADGSWKATPEELGAVNLMPSDPLIQAYHGLFGALVVEPLGATWVEDADSRASATVTAADGSAFRDFVLIEQNDIAARMNGVSFYDERVAGPLSGVNYKSDPMFYRYGARMDAGWGPQKATLGGPPPANWAHPTADELGRVAAYDWGFLDTSAAVSNTLVGGDPATPVFTAPAGMPVRFHLFGAQGNGDNQQVFELSGHAWPDEPYTHEGTAIGLNGRSTWAGAVTGFGPTGHFDLLIRSAGGDLAVPGDYLYRSWTSSQIQAGQWGIFRVTPRAGK